VYKELFLQSCPKYLNVNPPPYEDEGALSEWNDHPPQDATQRHLELFLSDVTAVNGVSSVRNLLKLYTSIDAAKLSAFMQTADENGEEDVLQQLMVLKAASRTYAKGQGDGSLLDGDRIVTNNLDFTIDGVSQIVPLGDMSLIKGLVHGERRGDNLASEICWVLYPVSTSAGSPGLADLDTGTPNMHSESSIVFGPRLCLCHSDQDQYRRLKLR